MRALLVIPCFAIVALIGASPANQTEKTSAALVVLQFAPAKLDPALDTRRFLLSPEVVFDDKDDSLRLARSLLLTDGLGTTDFHQTDTLSDRIQVKKIFTLDSAEVGAELFFFGSAKQVHVNGKLVSPPARLVSTGWSRVAIPQQLLKAGDNEIVFSGGGRLLLEPAHKPGKSFKSGDGGRTWSNEALGAKSTQQGEYLVRLRLGRHATRGWAMSQVIDLWTTKPGDVAIPGRVLSLQGLSSLRKAQPDGTRIAAAVRTGSTPTPDDKTWTGWMPLDKEYSPSGATAQHRWAQLKFVLETTRSMVSPSLPREFSLAYRLEPGLPPRKEPLLVQRPKNDMFTNLKITSLPFVYQEPSARLKLLRERYKLDDVIAPGQTEMEQLMLLRYWVRNQWHTAWGSHPAQWMPPWDSLIILESKDQPDCLTMCTHYAAVFTQCCLALGWNARHCILDHHCVAEVYAQSLNKWIMMDAGNSAQRADVGLHFEKDGAALSALELHNAYHGGKTQAITVRFTPARLVDKIAHLCRPAPPPKKAPLPKPDVIPLAELPKFPVCQIENYRRYAFPARNNFLSSLVPGELYQGWSEYFYDGYCWVGDSMDDPKISPEYTRLLSPSRPQDIDWHLNWCRIHLAHTAKADEVRVDIETLTPNLAKLEKKNDREALQTTPASFVWRLRPGENVLTVRSVNLWGKAGTESSVTVTRPGSDR
jgi:hypothetical protein